jgi:excisionase family DNA binding protein
MQPNREGTSLQKPYPPTIDQLDPSVYRPTAVTEIIRAKGTFWLADELGDLLSISRKHIYKLAKAGRIPHYRLFGSIRFDPEAVAQWLESRAIN